MHTLLLLTTLLLSVSTSAYNPFSAFSKQRPLAPDIEFSFPIPPPRLPYPPIWIRCPPSARWRCIYSPFFGPVRCQCIFEPIAVKGKPGIGSQAKEKHNRSLEIVTELQPGNNQTLVSLFRLECEEKNFVGCVSDGREGFECGCYERGGYESAAEEEGLEDGSGTNTKLKIRGLEESEVEKSTIRGHGGFPSRGVHFPHCTKIGYSLKCRRGECFCGPDNVPSPPDEPPNPPDDPNDPPNDPEDPHQ